MAERWSIAVGFGAALALAAAAAAGGLPALPKSKPGLYEFGAATNGSIFRGHGAAELPEKDLQRLAAEALAQTAPVFQFCVPEGGSKLLDPVSVLGPGCTYAKVVTTRNGYTAQARCVAGQRADTAELTVEAGTAEHRTVTLSMPLPGTSLSFVTRYETTWLSSDCGDIPPGARRRPDGKLITPANP